MRVLITGGAGHLGINICKTFLQESTIVRVFDIDNSLNRKRTENLGANAEVFWGDITQPDSVTEATEDVDAIVHMAAVLPPLSEQNPELANNVNVGGTQTIVNTIKERGNSIPFIFISSVTVFGPTPDATKPLHPDRNKPKPSSIYAKTKVQAEDFIRESGIDYLIMRLTLVPYLNLTASAIKNAMLFIIPLNKRIPLHNRLEFCHPDDVTLAVINAVNNFNEVKGKTLVIAGGTSQQMRYQDMVHAMFGTIGLPIPPRHKFTDKPFELDWYDTTDSQELLRFQRKTLHDYAHDLANQFPILFISMMRYFIGPIFGKVIVKLIWK
jgi:UDP-glucose 4-epimerase